MRTFSIVGAMLALTWWEWPNLKRWGSGERWAFWVGWGLMLVWATAEQMKVPIPSLPLVQWRLLQPLAKKLLTPMPNPFW